ncbi:uncharacterized protein KD926_010044 [Aspergillus affinis]|uniref:uncharacterized protein n=1 Tax=Aspergillus affinis TaxID=1070780 RepID=UPI0022FEE531|nr:uncharacterized protein KD926_010044 [Aspergillus affinis]KAI9039059.1 hypothetical protein KD926_010044 [Aspergillus affinis]
MPSTELSSLQRDLPRRIIKKRGTTRERTGCLTCRKRIPGLQGMRAFELYVQMGGPETPGRRLPRHGLSLQSGQSSSGPVRLSSAPDPVNEHSDGTSPMSRRHFLRYYTQIFTYLMTTNVENNSFLSGETSTHSIRPHPAMSDHGLVLLPMAMHSPPVLNTLIAWSSAHLSLRDKSFEHVAMQNRCAALRDLRNALESNLANVETNLAMSLILFSLESIMADKMVTHGTYTLWERRG